jgi:transaldolase
MRLFIDTANVEEIKKVNAMGIISGVTTNPTLIAKEGRVFKEVILEITNIVNGPISAEVMSLEADGMVAEAREIARWHQNIVIKIPMSVEGLKATSILHREGIKTNLTLVFSTTQAILAARAGATYVSPFVGRLDDTGFDGIKLIRELAEVFSVQKIQTEIITASVRNLVHVIEAAKAGAHIATVPYKVLIQMAQHPLTDAGIEKFLNDWKQLENMM